MFSRIFFCVVSCFVFSASVFAEPTIETSRKSSTELNPPTETDSFFFLVFGDRTSGVPEGLKTLDAAVQDANRLSPDFVMNIGDMVQGYNTTAEWTEQMKEYKAVMNKLQCPWFPTPGNHDLYWRGDNKPEKEHETDFEANFGPLWYAFCYKNNWFIVLCTDEGNLKTGEKSSSKPECQTMSDEQFNWLKLILQKAKGADGVFVFLHHPRWYSVKNYGTDWDKVHQEFVKNGNVKAVFAGHIHHMQYLVKDGIQYVTLATTGGKLSKEDAKDGYLHEIHFVSVRKGNEPKISAFHVSATLDLKEVQSKPQPKPEVKKEQNPAPLIPAHQAP